MNAIHRAIETMSGSEMGNREPFTVDLHSMRLDFATATDGTPLYNNPLQPNASPTFHPSTAVTSAPININGGEAGGESVTVTQAHVGSTTEPKKKRGRPRKYGPDGRVGPASPAVGLNNNQNLNQSGGGGAVSPGIASATPNVMKKRGRPRGSRNKHRHTRVSGKVPYSTHVITVKTGEDLTMKIASLTTNGPRNVCILSANGTISNVTLRQPTLSGLTVTYEGRFEILALRGSLLVPGDGHYQSAGNLSLTMAGPDGQVLGGGIEDACIAASPIQIVLMSFAMPGRKARVSANQMENIPAPPTAGQSSSPSRGTFSESSGEEGSPLDLSAEACNNNNTLPDCISGMPWK